MSRGPDMLATNSGLRNSTPVASTTTPPPVKRCLLLADLILSRVWVALTAAYEHKKISLLYSGSVNCLSKGMRERVVSANMIFLAPVLVEDPNGLQAETLVRSLLAGVYLTRLSITLTPLALLLMTALVQQIGLPTMLSLNELPLTTLVARGSTRLIPLRI